MPDAWINGMIAEGERRAEANLAEQRDRVLALLPEHFRPVVRTLVLAAIATGQDAAFQVLNEQGWLRPELGEAAS